MPCAVSGKAYSAYHYSERHCACSPLAQPVVPSYSLQLGGYGGRAGSWQLEGLRAKCEVDCIAGGSEQMHEVTATEGLESAAHVCWYYLEVPALAGGLCCTDAARGAAALAC